LNSNYKMIKSQKTIFLSLFLLFFFGLNVFSQPKSLSKEAMIKDFEVFQDIFEQANSGLYKYHSKEKIDSVFSVNKNKITDTTSYREFYNIIFEVVDFSGSSHNYLDYPSTIKKGFYTQNLSFPIPIKYISGKIYTNIKYGEIPLGSEIIAVNGIQAEDFIEDVSKYTTTDGFNKTGKYAFLETSYLPLYVYLAYGEQENFEIEYKFEEKIQKKKLPAITYNQFYKIYSKRYIPKYEERKSAIDFHYLQDIKTGLLSVHTFGLGGPETEKHKEYAKFLEKVFQDLKDKNIENLIVDIRDNGGGNDPNDILLFSYLTDRKFHENIEAFITTTEDIPMKEYFSIQNIDVLKEMVKESKETFTIHKNGKYYLDPELNPEWEPNKNAFQGNIYLLIDPFVASAGSLFASMIKSDEKAVVIGQETLGGYYGHTGHLSVEYILPNSEFVLSFSVVDLKQDVKKLPDQKIGEGVKPNFTVEPSINDYLKGEDKVLKFAIDLIKNKIN